MPELSTLQAEYRDHLISMAIGGSAYLPTLLLIGPHGAGKRTIARAAANSLGMDFVNVRVDGAPKSVEEMLLGTATEAQNAVDRRSAPGVLGNASSALIYLSGIENLHSSLWNSLAFAMTTKTFRDLLGYSWRISGDVWIVGALSTSSDDFLVGPEHWLCARFEQRMRIFPPTDADDLLTICRSIISELSVARGLDSSVAGFFADRPNIPDHLHSIRRWIEIASTPPRRQGSLTREDLEAATVEDLRWVLSRLSYRGASLTSTVFSRWAGQFRSELRPLAAHLVRQIAERYFISQNTFYKILDELITKSGIQPGSPVAFCRWEPVGKSSPRMAHAVKNQARWKSVDDIDLSADPRTWPNLEGKGVRYVVLADDFVGSGKTLARLFSTNDGALTLLMRKNPGVLFHVLVIAGFEGGFRNIRFSVPPELLKKVRLVAGRIFTSRDQCFEDKSRILPSSDQRNALRQFCLDVAAVHYPNLYPNSRLGFGAIGALVVFPDTVPNNTLPILWHDTGTWQPLFPASGLH